MMDLSNQQDASVGLSENTLPDVSPRGGVQSTLEGESEAGIKPSWGQAFSAHLNQLSFDSPVGVPFFNDETSGSLVRAASYYNLNKDLEAANAKKSTPEELNKRYPDMPASFSEPEYPEVADLKYSVYLKQKKLQEWISRGPEYGMFGNLAVGAFSAADPANALSMMALGGVDKALSIPSNLASVYATNVAAMAINEVPSYLQRKAENLNPDLGSTATNIFAGAAIGTGIHYAVGSILNKIKSFPEDLKERAVRQAIVQEEMGQRTNLSDIQVADILRRAGMTAPDAPPSSYQFNPLAHPSDSAHFIGYDSTGKQIPLAPELGTEGGVHAQDNHVGVNNVSDTMQVMGIDPGSKLLDLSSPISEGEAAPIASEIIKKFGLKDLPENMTLRQLIGQISTESELGRLPDNATKDVHDLVKGAGYDGYKYVDSVAGQPTSNGVYMFDDSRSNMGERLASNEQVKPDVPMTENTLNEELLKHPETQKDYSPELQDKIIAQSNRPTLTEDKYEPIVKAQLDQSNQVLKSLAEEDPEVLKAVQENQKQNAQDAQEASALKNLIDCYTKEIV